MYGVKILSTASYFPEKILTNFDLEKMVNTSDEWITTRTGIKERHIAEQDTSASMLSLNACKKTIDEAGISVDEIDMIIVATITPDSFFPSTACNIQKELKATNATCFDISAACSGGIYGLYIAKGLIESGNVKTVLLICVEIMSKIVNWKDRNTCVLFGDAAGAMLLTRTTPDQTNILSLYTGSDGNYGDLLKLPAGGSKLPVSIDTIKSGLHYVQMNGREIFKLAILKMIEALDAALKMCDKKQQNLDLLIPHQANLRIIEAMIERLSIPREKVFVNLHKYGNTSASATLTALDEAIRTGLIKKGSLVGLVAFGAGLTWGATILKF